MSARLGLIWAGIAVALAEPAVAAPMRGMVTCNGQPAYHAMVQGFADADATAPLGEAFTDAKGQFSLTLKPGATVLRARRSVRDDTGEPRRLQSLAVPIGSKTPVVALVEREVRNRDVPATPGDLQWCTRARPVAEQSQIEGVVARLAGMASDGWAGEVEGNAAMLKRYDAEPVGHVLDERLKAAELRHDLDELTRMAALTTVVGLVIDEPELQAAGQAWQAIVDLYRGKQADALQKFWTVLVLQQKAVDRETRPGWRKGRLATLALFYEFAGNLAGAIHDGATVGLFGEAAKFYEEVDQPRDAAKLHQQLGFTASLAGDAAKAVQSYAAALRVLGDLPEPLLRARIQGRWAQLAKGDEQLRLLRAAEIELAKARPGLESAGIQIDLGKAWSGRDDYQTALVLLDAAVKTLDGLPASPLRRVQQWSALGASGRGYVHFNLRHLPQAAADLRRAIPLQPDSLPPQDCAAEQQMLGYVLAEQGQQPDARAAFELGITLAQKGTAERDRDRELLLREQVAWTWLDSEPPEPAKALQVLDEAIQKANRQGLTAREGRLCETAAHAASPEATAPAAQRKRTLTYLERAESCYDQTKDAEGLARVRRHLAQERRLMAFAEQQSGRRADAETSLRAALAEFERSGARADAQEAADQLALLLYEQRRWLEAAALWQKHADWLATPEAEQAAADTVANLPRPSAETKRNLTPGARRAVTLSLLASCYTAAGEADQALAVRQQEAGLRSQQGDVPGASGAWQQLALDAAVAGRRPLFDKALRFLVDHASDASSKAMVAALRILPDVLGSDLEAARRAKDELANELAALSVGAADLPERQGLVQGWAMLGSLQARLGEPGPGLASLQKAADWSDAAGKAAMLSKIGHLCRMLGRLQEALDAQQKVLELADQAAMYVKPSYLLTTLADVFEVYQALGNRDGAQTVLRRALAVAQEVEAQPRQQADDRKILADFQAMLALRSVVAGHPEQGLELADRALAVYPRQFHDENTATAAMARALARNLAFLKASTAALRQATANPKSPEFAKVVADVERGQREHAAELQSAMEAALAELAVTPLALGASALQGVAGSDKAKHSEVQKILDLAHQRALAGGRVSDLSTLSWLAGRSAEAIGDRQGAIVAYRRAIEEEEVVRTSLASDIHKAALGESRDQVYASLERLYAQEGQAAEALEVSEQRRARALLDVLATGQLRGKLRNNAPSRELQQLAERMQALAAQDQALDLQLGSGPVARLDAASGKRQLVDTARPQLRVRVAGREAAAEALWRQLAEARRRAAGSSAELTSLVTAPAVQVDELRSMARQRGAHLLEWSVHDDTLWIYVVSPAGRVDGRQVSVTAKDLETKVRALRGALGAGVDRDLGRGGEALGAPEPSGGDATALLADLHRTLIAPVADLLPLDGKTPVIVAPHRSLLLLPLVALTDAKGQPWGASTSLAVVPSLGVLRYTQAKHTGAAKGGALVVGNPQMPVWQGQPLPPLAGAEREAAEVARTLAGPGIELLTGAKATETKVRKSMQGKRFLHLATHGVARDDQPGESFVALAKDAGADGLLTVGEVLDLQLQADLVVLSACQTGLGKVSGDGVLGLGRAFLYAGTPRVVVSLWSVPDEPTALLMATFYAGLRAGQAPADALRAAQSTTRAKFPDPRAWAAFAMVGEPR